MPRFKKILLVNPMGTQQNNYTPSPLGILYLAAFIREKNKKVKIAVVDAAIEGEKILIEKIKRFKPDLVGISVLTAGRHNGIKVAKIAKRLRPFCKVVMGGIHPTLMWQQMMENYKEIDFIVKGEGELTFYELVCGRPFPKIKGLVFRKRQTIVNNPNRELIKDLDLLPFPAWDLVNLYKYPPRGEGEFAGIDLKKEIRFSLIFSRGCMGSCTFCSSWLVWKGYRSRSGKNVAAEIAMLYKNYQARHFCFQDDTLTGNRKEMIIFCQELIRRKIKVAIFGTTRIDQVDEYLLKLMRKAGFYNLSFGIESGSPSMLLKINKKTDLLKIERAIKFTKKAGICATALMMYGLPGETDKDRQLSDKLLKRIKPDGIGTLGLVWIFPGTALYEQAKHAKLLDDRFWLTKKPYYIYRGGIGNEPVKRILKIQDEIKFVIRGTFLETIGYKILTVSKRFLD